MDVPSLQLGISDAALMAAYACGVGECAYDTRHV